MARFLCKCGNVISDGRCPNEVTGDILSNKSAEVFFDGIVSTIDDFFVHFRADRLSEWREKYFNETYPKDLSPGNMLHDVLHGLYLKLRLAMMECDQCGRLWIQESSGKNMYHSYQFEGKDGRPKVLGLNEIESK